MSVGTEAQLKEAGRAFFELIPKPKKTQLASFYCSKYNNEKVKLVYEEARIQDVAEDGDSKHNISRRMSIARDLLGQESDEFRWQLEEENKQQHEKDLEDWRALTSQDSALSGTSEDVQRYAFYSFIFDSLF
jgi:hypothetical protein